MALNKTKLNPKNLLQISLILLGIILIFFTYFYNNKQFKVTKTIEEKEINEKVDGKDSLSTFEDIQYEGLDTNGNKFVINAKEAEFASDKPNLIYMENILCRFFFKDGTILKITSNRGMYDNITDDMEFEENVKMYYLENRLFSDKASYVNSKNYLLVQDNVFGDGPQGEFTSDQLNVDLLEKKMKISMYNESKVNIKVNY
tara:strand:+ start:1596 stop:2198 length:603 start_codon:yes stop_codon:yes gene_type:complete